MYDVLVSIIIPIYNAEKYICECLESVKAQTYEKIEVILIDDGSCDSSARLCKQICKQDDRFKYLFQENKGVSSARNKGLTCSTGDYITFMDADDLLRKTAIEDLVRVAVSNDADLSVCGVEMFGARSGEIIPAENESVISKKIYFEAVATNDSIYGGGYPFAKIWKRSSLIKNGEVPFFDERFRIYEDKIWLLENVLNIDRIVLSPCKVYRYRFSRESSSHRDRDDFDSQILLVRERLADLCKDRVCEKTQKEIMDSYAMQIADGVMKGLEVSGRQKEVLRTRFADVIFSRNYRILSKVKYIISLIKIL